MGEPNNALPSLGWYAEAWGCDDGGSDFVRVVSVTPNRKSPQERPAGTRAETSIHGWVILQDGRAYRPREFWDMYGGNPFDTLEHAMIADARKKIASLEADISALERQIAAKEKPNA